MTGKDNECKNNRIFVIYFKQEILLVRAAQLVPGIKEIH